MDGAENPSDEGGGHISSFCPQGKTHTLKPGIKDHSHTLAKGQPAQPLEDISMRIYLCEGLLGAFWSLNLTSTLSILILCCSIS